MQKSESIRTNMEPYRQPHRDSSIPIFSDALTAFRIATGLLGLSQLCVSLLWPHRLAAGTKLKSPSRRGSLLCHRKASIPVSVIWSILVLRDPGLPEQARLFHPKRDTQALYYILLLTKLLALFCSLKEQIIVSECPLTVFDFVY